MARTMTDSVVNNAMKMGDELKQGGRNAYLVGLGAIAEVEDQTRGFYDRLMAKGAKLEKDDSRLVGKAFKEVETIGRKIEKGVSRTVSGTLQRAGVPNRDEIHTLIQRVEELTRKVEAMSEAKPAPARRATMPQGG